MRRILIATVVAVSVPQMAAAATVPADGYIYHRQVLAELTEACVAHGPGGVFVGVGPALSFPADGATRDVVFVSDTGSVRTVATGLNSIADCVYDAAAGVLYVTDSGAEFNGATTGDTVFAIPGDATGLAVAGTELLPSGSIAQAFGIGLTSSGLLVSNAVGGGAGSVLAIDLSGVTPVLSTFATGFDYTGGLVVDAGRVLISEAIEPAFTSAVYSYSPAGAYQSTLSGPTYDHGSIDLAIAADAGVLATGSPTLVSIDPSGVATPLVSGLDGGTPYDAFGGGVSVQPFTGRIDFLASSFSGADDDRSVHRLVPVDRLVSGGGNPLTDCAMELYGIELVAPALGRPARSAICTDGAPCDADGAADGGCTFALGICLNVADARLVDCAPTAVATVELIGANIESTELTDLVAAVAATLPSASSECTFSDGIRIPIRVLSSGRTRAGKAVVKLRATTDEEDPQKDSDVVRLVCTSAAP